MKRLGTGEGAGRSGRDLQKKMQRRENLSCPPPGDSDENPGMARRITVALHSVAPRQLMRFAVGITNIGPLPSCQLIPVRQKHYNCSTTAGGCDCSGGEMIERCNILLPANTYFDFCG
jgi:hypothetical protein